jgi:hypothetical protein
MALFVGLTNLQHCMDVTDPRFEGSMGSMLILEHSLQHGVNWNMQRNWLGTTDMEGFLK